MEFPDSNVTITLDRPRVMVINGNTMAAYERATGKFFLDTVMKLFDAMPPPSTDGTVSTRAVFQVLRAVPMEDLRALAWSALHEYDGEDEASWPLTISQVGRFISPGSVLPIFTAFLRGYAASTPSKETLGESPAALRTTTKTMEANSTTTAANNSETQSTQPDGGTPGSAVPASAFDLPEEKQAA